MSDVHVCMHVRQQLSNKINKTTFDADMFSLVYFGHFVDQTYNSRSQKESVPSSAESGIEIG